MTPSGSMTENLVGDVHKTVKKIKTDNTLTQGTPFYCLCFFYLPLKYTVKSYGL